MIKVIIAGSRDFDDYDRLEEMCDKFLSRHKEVEIVSGTARGADRLGEQYAVRSQAWLYCEEVPGRLGEPRKICRSHQERADG